MGHGVAYHLITGSNSAFLVGDTTQSALQCIVTPVTGFNINPALIVHLLNSLGSILARCHFRGGNMPHQATNNICILPGTHLYTCVESSNADSVLLKDKKCQALTGIEPIICITRSHSNIVIIIIITNRKNVKIKWNKEIS